MTRVGRRYDSTGLAKALRLIEVMNQMKFHQDHEIHMIDVSDEQNLSMFIEGGIEIKIGGEDFRNRLAMLNKTFETGRLDKSQIKYIDLRFGNVIIGPR
jgi:cell division septal protein FtsQ